MQKPSEVNGNSNLELKGILSERFKDMFWKILSLLEIAFPHEKGDGSDNEKRFNALRSKILRIGNDSVRDLDAVFDSYVSFKVSSYERIYHPEAETLIIDFKNKWKVNDTKGKVGE